MLFKSCGVFWFIAATNCAMLENIKMGVKNYVWITIKFRNLLFFLFIFCPLLS